MQTMRSGAKALCAAILAVLALATGTADAAIPMPPRPETIAPDRASTVSWLPVVVVDWEMPERFDTTADPRRYGSEPGRTRQYVNPTDGWKVKVTTCGSYSESGATITARSWRLLDLGGTQIASSTTCEKTVSIPAPGSYIVEATVRSTHGDVTTRRQIEAKDYLIVVAGDSMASGEGNPDTPGKGDVSWCGSSDLEEQLMPYSCVVQLLDVVFHNPSVLVEGGTPSTWLLDPDCHRSFRSGLSLAAKEIEDRDPHSSVTYVNVACSGAETQHVSSERYSGRYDKGEEWNTGVKPPQAEQIALAVCGDLYGRCDDADDRPIDGLFLSMGINDLSFSALLTDCAKPEWLGPLDPEGCEEEWRDDVVDDIEGLRASYRAIGDRFHSLGVPINSIYQALYPTDVFSPESNGCGFLRFVNGIEKSFLDEMNHKLNSALPWGHEHYSWAPVWRDPKTNPWDGHGYCADEQRWMVRIDDSLKRYVGVGDDIHAGAMHPNQHGHAVLQQEFVNEFDQRSRPVTNRLEVTFEAVQALDIEESLQGSMVAAVARRGTDGADRWGQRALVTLPDTPAFRSGAWEDLGAGRVTLQLGLNRVEQLSVTGKMAVYMPPSSVSCPDDWSDGGTHLRAAIQQDPTGGGESPTECLEANIFERLANATHASSAGFGSGVQTATDSSGRFRVQYRVRDVTCFICGLRDVIAEPGPVARSSSTR